MSDQEIFTAVRDLIVEVKLETAPIDPGEVSEDLVFDEPPLSMDSIDFVRLIVSIEETFGVIAQDGDVAAMRTVKDMVATVGRWVSTGSEIG